MNNWIPTVGDIVWFDELDIKFPIKGQIKKIYRYGNHKEDFADIYVGKHGVGKVTKAVEYIYPSKQAYEEAKRFESERKQAEFWEQTSTIEGLLNFLDGREMLIRGDSSDDAWAVIQRRLKESRGF